MSSSVSNVASLRQGFWRSTLILSFIAVAVLSAAAVLVSNAVRIQLFKNDSVFIIQNYAESEHQFDLNELADKPELHAELIKKLGMLMQMFKLVEVKVWTDDMRAVFSFTDKDSVGKYFPDNKELAEAIRDDKVILSLDKGRSFENKSLSKYNLMLEMYVPVHMNGHVHGVLEVYRQAPQLKFFGRINLFAALLVLVMGVLFNLMIANKFRSALNTILEYQTTLIKANEGIANSYHHAVISLAKALEMRDMETEGHCERVVNMSVFIGKKMGLSETELGKLAIGAYLHDVGKIGVPDNVLLKPGRLDPDERKIIETHVMKGFDIIKNVPFLRHAEEVVKYHHEKFDGTGYPAGLKGEEIPITARIFALVDVFDALISKRPYKDPMPLDKILAIIREERGKHFCPAVTDVLLSMSDEEILSINRDVQSETIAAIVNESVMSLIEKDFPQGELPESLS